MPAWSTPSHAGRTFWMAMLARLYLTTAKPWALESGDVFELFGLGRHNWIIGKRLQARGCFEHVR